MSLHRCAVAALLLLSLVPLVARAEIRYSVMEIPTFGGTAGEGNGLNESGYVVGQSPTTGGVQHAYRYDGSSLIDLTVAAGKFEGVALGVNDLSQVVGYDRGAEISAPYHAFLYDKGVTTDLGTLGGFGSRAHGINNSEHVVGEADTGTIQHPGPIHAFLWTASTGMQDLGALAGHSWAYGINDASQVVGSTGTPAGVQRAFVWAASTGMVTLGTLGGRHSGAYAINNVGQVAGWGNTSFNDGNTTHHAFLWSESGGMIDLGTLGTAGGAEPSEAHGINDEGWVVGWSSISDNPDDIPHAFLYDGVSMRDLNTLIDPSLGWTMFSASDINNAGQIVVEAVDTNHRYRALLLTPIPEPVSAPVILVMTVALIASRTGR